MPLLMPYSTPIPHKSYHAQFGHSMSNGVGIISGVLGLDSFEMGSIAHPIKKTLLPILLQCRILVIQVDLE